MTLSSNQDLTVHAMTDNIKFDLFYQTIYIPHQHICIDETMIGLKGHLAWVQYMPKKPTKWGIKAWVLADSENGYVWNFKSIQVILIQSNTCTNKLVINKYAE